MTTGSGSARQVPYHCPYCAEQDLRPHGTTAGAWHCRACLRLFSVRFLGLEPISPSPTSAGEIIPQSTGATR